jgi:drug/metabolite transporter (DMT)-like permease
LAVLSAASFGAGDFLGGLASRRSGPLRVVAVSQLYGLALVLLLLPVFSPDVYAINDLLWGAAAGMSGGAGLVALYRGLSRARMSVVAPVTAGVAAVVPALYGLVAGERPSAVASCGVVVALLAIFIVSRAPHASGIEVAAGWTGSRGLPEAIAAGMGFGAFFIFLSNASPDSGVWPLVGARLASLALLWLLVAALPGTVSIRKETNVLILGAGLLDIIANALFLYATRRGLLTLVAVLSSLYPAATVLLARVVLRERLSRTQVGGVVLAIAGMALIAAG